MTTTIIACIITALIAGTLGCFMSAIVMWAGRNDEMEERCRSCSAQNEEGFAVMIDPDGDLQIMRVDRRNLERSVERFLGDTYTTHRLRKIEVSDTIYGFAVNEDSLPHNRYASELFAKELFGCVVLLPFENGRYVAWDIDKTDALRSLVSMKIKLIKNREEEIYGADQT